MQTEIPQLFDYQQHVLDEEYQTPADKLRVGLYYKTGAGKTLTSLLLVKQAGCNEAVVVTPPSTFDTWKEWGERVGVTVMPMSHALFRSPSTRLNRDVAFIGDEFHLFGGHGKKGMKKLDRLAAGLRAPLIAMSATPNYNDAERCYNFQHVLDPLSCRGGFIQFLHDNCNTAANPYGMTPLVDEVKPFKNYDSASEYLAALPHVYYVEDDLVYTIKDIEIREKNFPEMDQFGIDLRRKRMIASLMEERHARVFHNLIDVTGRLDLLVYDKLRYIVHDATTPVLAFAAHSTVANAYGESLHRNGVKHAVVTGSTPAKKKQERLDAFRDGVLDVLIGTASLATGTDGLDKVCDTLVILDDTDDDALRRQLIGRIMPRGADVDASKKEVFRLVLTP